MILRSGACYVPEWFEMAGLILSESQKVYVINSIKVRLLVFSVIFCFTLEKGFSLTPHFEHFCPDQDLLADNILCVHKQF